MILACKKTWQTDKKKVGLGQTPPLVWEKFPRKVVFFLVPLMGAQLNSPAQVAVEVKNMKLPCGEILTRVSHATCPLELQRKCNLPAGEKYRS